MKRRLEVGRIYVNAWNPAMSGFYVGRKGKEARLIRSDMTELLLPPSALVPSINVAFDAGLFREQCEWATDSMTKDAKLYAKKVLWPAEFDDETKAKIWRKEYTPPTFEEWQAKRRDR